MNINSFVDWFLIFFLLLLVEFSRFVAWSFILVLVSGYFILGYEIAKKTTERLSD